MFLSVALLLFGWEVDALFFLLFVAFVPLFYVVHRNEHKRESFITYYLTFFLFFGLSNLDLFIEGFKTTALIFGLLILPAIWTLPFILMHWVKERRSISYAILSFPFFYASLEVLNYYWEIAFPWHHLGLGLSSVSFFNKLYGLVGVEGLGLLISGFNASLFYFMIHYKVAKNLKSKLIRAIPLLVILLIIILSTMIGDGITTKRKIKIAVLHPSTQTYLKLESNTKSQYEYINNTLEHENFQGADLLICGESFLEDMNRFPLIINELDSHPAIKALKELSVKYQTPILSGAILVEMKYAKTPPTFTSKKKSNGEFFDIYNGSVLIHPSDTTAWRSKQKFVPITEIYPFLSFFEFLFDKKIINFQGQSSYGSSVNMDPYQLNELTISPQICFENLFPNSLLKRGVEKSDLQVLMTNNWSNSSSIINKQSAYAKASVNSFGVPLIFAGFDSNVFYHGLQDSKKAQGENLSMFSFQLQSKRNLYPLVMHFYHLFLAVSSILLLTLSYTKSINPNEKTI